MTCRPLGKVLLAWLGLATMASAGQDLFDLVPEDAPAALVMRDIDALRKKGDQLIAEAGLQGMGRPSDLFNLLVNSLDLQGKIQTDGRAAVVVTQPARKWG